MAADLSISTLGDLSQVILGSSGDPPKEDLLRNPSSQGHTHAVQQLLLGVEVLLLGQVLSVTQTLTPRDD